MCECEKFHYDRLRNDRALGNRKSDNNKKNKKKYNNKNNNTESARNLRQAASDPALRQ